MQEKWHRAVEDAPEPNGHGIATGMRSLFDVLVYVVQWALTMEVKPGTGNEKHLKLQILANSIIQWIQTMEPVMV